MAYSYIIADIPVGFIGVMDTFHSSIGHRHDSVPFLLTSSIVVQFRTKVEYAIDQTIFPRHMQKKIVWE